MSRFICVTCGTQYAESATPPPACPICEDERQYVGLDGQKWTTLDELRATHTNEIYDEHGLTAIEPAPKFGIGERALLVPHGEANVLWDCVSLLDDATVAAVRERGGLHAIAISHPHYYTTMVDWAAAFDCPILLHADDAEWIMRPDPRVVLWSGEIRELGEGLTLHRLGGHYAGATVLHWPAGDALLTGDVIQVIPDRSHVGFMWSYPNLIPLPVAVVADIAARVEPLDFDVIYGAFPGFVIPSGAKDAVRRSAARYAARVGG